MNAEAKPAAGQQHATDLDPVELASMDSFPASDPPAWIPVHAGGPATPVRQKCADEPVVQKTNVCIDTPTVQDTVQEQSAPDAWTPHRVLTRPSRLQ